MKKLLLTILTVFAITCAWAGEGLTANHKEWNRFVKKHPPIIIKYDLDLSGCGFEASDLDEDEEDEDPIFEIRYENDEENFPLDLDDIFGERDTNLRAHLEKVFAKDGFQFGGFRNKKKLPTIDFHSEGEKLYAEPWEDSVLRLKQGVSRREFVDAHIWEGTKDVTTVTVIVEKDKNYPILISEEVVEGSRKMKAGATVYKVTVRAICRQKELSLY